MKGKDTTAHRPLRLLPELEWRLNLTLNSWQGFAYANTTKPELLQVENYKMSMVCRPSPWGGIYRGECDLHQLGEVILAPGGGRSAKPRGQPAGWSGLHQLSPSTRASPSHVDAWQPKLGPNHLKPWPASRPLSPLGLGSGPLGPHVKYTPVVMMILTFGQLHFVIPWNAPIWYLSSWNEINTKIVELAW
jgi:hypothetical protein